MNEIFKILEEDARKTPQQIATMTGIPLSKVKGAIKQAERDRTILKYKAIVNWDRLGEGQVVALVEVRIVPQRDVGFDAIAERIYRFTEARSVYLMSGTYDLAVLVAGKTMQEVASFVTQKLAPLDGVQGTVTHFLLKRYKEDGEVLEVEKRPKRVPIMP
ncbi:MAG: AsnC family transcriptional regulator [Dehalococcoidia bacterium DG_18]|nr:MAG: AsnC family transcriptional regulator [Dehalococcoidia bacterium DG_18]